MNVISQNIKVSLSICIIALGMGEAHAAGDIEKGEKVFKKCMTCHKIGEGAKNAIGPVLTGVVGRKAATVPDYSYGKSMRQARETGLVWSEESLDGWLTNPKKYLRKILDTRKAKSKMKFKLKKQADRDNVIAYLKTFSVEIKKDAMKKDGMQTEATPGLAKPAMVVAATDICVENQSGKTLLFVAEAKGGERVVKTLKAAENLCVPQKMIDAGGTVGVFLDEDAMEGCSRLAKAGQPERLVAYEPFDNCTWAQ